MNWDTFIEDMVLKIDKKEELSEKELSNLCDFAYDEIEYEERRWTIDTKSIIKYNERFFAIDWDRGLTESQENMFYNQPYEVRKLEEERMIKVVSYEKL